MPKLYNGPEYTDLISTAWSDAENQLAIAKAAAAETTRQSFYRELLHVTRGFFVQPLKHELAVLIQQSHSVGATSTDGSWIPSIRLFVEQGVSRSRIPESDKDIEIAQYELDYAADRAVFGAYRLRPMTPKLPSENDPLDIQPTVSPYDMYGIKKFELLAHEVEILSQLVTSLVVDYSAVRQPAIAAQR